jgi:hypothetical protein
MEALTRLVSDSLARHGFNRPVDPRRLQWSRWFLCDSPHSLLVVPSKPGIFAIAEEVLNVGTAAKACPERADRVEWGCPDSTTDETLGGAALQRCDSGVTSRAASAAEVKPPRRMLAVLQFSEDDDMAFTLDRMFTRPNPMRERLVSGSCFLRFVVIEDEDQRRNICNALNQWLLSSAEKASGIPAGFSSSLELTRVEPVPSPASAVDHTLSAANINAPVQTAHLDSGFNENRHCPQPFPSGF